MKLKVGTFNLFQYVNPPYSWYNKKEKYTQKQWLVKTTWIKEQIIKMDCDIIGFQEVFCADSLKELLEKLGFIYFKTVQKAKFSNTEENTYISTTVAIASKYPIVNIQDVKPNKLSLEKHKFKEEFYFSRIPIKATIKLANKEELLVYVCHLKSNRQNEQEYIFSKNDSIKYKKELTKEVLYNNNTKNLKQRLCEASGLFFDIKEEKDKNIVLLCDLNDKEFSLSIDALTNEEYHNNKHNKILFDAYNEYEQISNNINTKIKRTNTSYFETNGAVLDYIFVSKSFSKYDKYSVANVVNYKVYDEHLKKSKKSLLLKSDHAQVVCEILFK